MAREAQLKNANKSVMRALLKDCKAPDLYWGEVPCHDPKTQTDGHMTKLPFILPHELLQNMLGKDAKLLGELTSNPLLPGEQQFKDSFCEKFEVPATQCLGLGVFGDGVPHQKKQICGMCLMEHSGPGCQLQEVLVHMHTKELYLQVWLQWQTHHGSNLQCLGVLLCGHE